MGKMSIKTDAKGNILYTVTYSNRNDVTDSMPEVDIPQGFNLEEFFFDGHSLINRGKRPASHFEWSGVAWIANTDKLAQQIRDERDRLLTESDWTQLPDSDKSDAQAWAKYRQDLRKLPDEPGFPTNVTWPVAPTISASKRA